MGLDTTHDAWHGAYSSFNQWRKWIALQIGIDLYKMEGFGGEISWDTVKDDLKYLLNHSDCDGYITSLRCKKIAVRLKEIIGDRKVPEDWYSSEDEDAYFLYKTKQFMKGCKLAHNRNERLEFH